MRTDPLATMKITSPARAGIRIRRIELFAVRVPLKKEIKHASHSRTESDNLVVKVELASGQVGYGEGVPRSYVTGETITSTFDTLGKHDWARLIGPPRDFADLVGQLESLVVPEIETDPRGMAGNAARCALEVALLDAYGRAFGESLGRAVELASVPGLCRFPSPRQVRYGAAITADSWNQEIRSAIKYYVYHFRDVKTKVGVEGQDDERRIRWFRWLLGPRVDLRIDANEAWHATELLDRVQPLLRYSLAASSSPCRMPRLRRLRTCGGGSECP